MNLFIKEKAIFEINKTQAIIIIIKDSLEEKQKADSPPELLNHNDLAGEGPCLFSRLSISTKYFLLSK